MGLRLVTSDPDQEGCQLQGPFSPPAEESYLSTISESHMEAKKSPTNHHISSLGSLLHCLYQTGESNIVPIGIKEGPTSHQYLTACHPEKVVPSVPRDFALKFNV